jgi:23S rRNA pseudouridine2605 synthase
MIRLQKLLSAAGVASRRASEELITSGRVTVNGEAVTELGSKANPDDDIRVDGRRIKSGARPRYIAMYKPKGYVTTRHDPEGRPTVIDLLGDAGYIYPVGRLDYDSEGLLLLTTDGELAATLTHPRHEVEKEYEVIVLGEPDPAALDKLRRGVFIDGRRTAPAKVYAGHVVKSSRPTLRHAQGRPERSRGATTRLTITLHEGRNRQIRKMCSAVGLPVRDLRRVRMGSVEIGRLRPGEWRDLSAREVQSLKSQDVRHEAGSPRIPRGPEGPRPKSERSERSQERQPASAKATAVHRSAKREGGSSDSHERRRRES